MTRPFTSAATSASLDPRRVPVRRRYVGASSSFTSTALTSSDTSSGRGGGSAAEAWQPLTLETSVSRASAPRNRRGGEDTRSTELNLLSIGRTSMGGEERAVGGRVRRRRKL